MTAAITSLEDFLRAVRPTRFGHVLYRGQPRCNLSCVPTLFRIEDAIVEEEILLAEWEHLARPSLGRDFKDSTESMALAQHFGVPTRMLDWTRNPLVALFFTCMEDKNRDGEVLELLLWDTLPNHREGVCHAGIRILDPPFTDARLVAQDSVLMVHEQRIDAREVFNQHIVVHKICGRHKEQILQALDRVGVSYRTLFPGLAGIGRYLADKCNAIGVVGPDTTSLMEELDAQLRDED